MQQKIDKLEILLDKEKAEKRQLQLEHERLLEKHKVLLIATGIFFNTYI